MPEASDPLTPLNHRRTDQPQANPPIIAVRGLTKHYGAARGRPPAPPALDRINLTIERGEILGLLGPNGAGKTTLISILCGLLPPTAGTVTVGGHNVLAEPLAVKRLLGLVPEEIALYPYLSGRRNLRYFGLLCGLTGHALDEAIERTLRAIGLADRADDRVSSYSNGMKRRLNIGVGLLHAPPVILLDEPTLGLDPRNRRGILELVLSLKRERGTTILYATHRMDEAQELSDRVAIIHRGRIVALDAPDALIRSLGAVQTVRLHTTSPAGSELIAALRRVNGVSQVLPGMGTLTLALHGAAEALPEILRASDRLNIRVDSLTIQESNLEDVFLRLTGENLAEVGL